MKSLGMEAINEQIKSTCSQTSGSARVGTAEAAANTLIDAFALGKGFYPEAQMGAFNASYARKNGAANIAIINPISLNSLLLHIPGLVGIKNPTKGHFGTVHQTLNIIVSDPCN